MASVIDLPAPPAETRFYAVLALSVGIHASVLWGWQGPRPADRGEALSLAATLRPILATSPSREEPGAPREAQAVRARMPVRPPAEVPRRLEVPAAAGIAEGPVALVPRAVVEAADSPGPLPAQEAAIGDIPARTAADQDGLLEGYGRRLTDLFSRQRAYPRVAEMRGWEGEVRLRLRVARKGGLLGVSVERSSGFEVLDQHALAFVEQLGRLPPLPEELDAGEVQVVVPLAYRLRKAG